jgi:D-alanyl-D-alanine carboxypeptidase/D-alanyl-D-alanine-endopeptidase (penicillin-binding protein 4)
VVVTLAVAASGVSQSRQLRAAPGEPTTIDATDTRTDPGRSIVAWAARNDVGLSITVAALPSGATILQHDGHIARNPASGSKLITALVALRTLGPSHRFRTRVHGRLVGGSVDRLIIRGEGDPSLSSDQVTGMAGRLSAMGLERVERELVVDQSHFDDQFVPPAFEQQPNEWAVFRAPVCATAVDGNRLVLHVVPGAVGSNAHVYVEPLGAAEISGTITSVERLLSNNRRMSFSVASATSRPLVRVGGEILATESMVTLQKRSDDPRLVAGYVLREALRARGVVVNGGVVLGSVEDAPSLLTHSSEALSAILHRLGKDSDNFAAEMLLKSIGVRVLGEGSSRAGAKVVLDTLAAIGVDAQNLKWTNGSGLFDANKISTTALVQALVAAQQDRRLAPEYLSQLAIAGVDGTLAGRLRQLDSSCFVRAKTGTLRDAVSLAGFVERKDGRSFAFALIAERVKNQSVTRSEIDRFVTSLCTANL